MELQWPVFDPTSLPSSLAVSNVGTRDYDVTRDRMRVCAAIAVLYGLPIERASEGVPIDQMAAGIHPGDRARGRAKRTHLLQHGGVFAVEYRVLPCPDVMRWVMVHGCFEADESGRIVRGRGIVVDLTESRNEGFADGDMFFVTGADEKTVGALDRITRRVVAAWHALNDMDRTGATRPSSAMDALLLETARHLVRAAVPVIRKRTEHWHQNLS